MSKSKKQIDIDNFYKTFLVGNKAKSLKDEQLYQLYKKASKTKKENASTFPSDLPANMVHQMDVLFLPDDEGYKYALVAVDLGSRATDAEPLKKLDSQSVLDAILKIYKRGILKQPTQTIQVDMGSEFKSVFKQYFENKNINLRVAQVNRHRQQGLVESRNKSIGTPLLKRQTAEELITGEPSREWVHYLPEVIKFINKKFIIKPEWDEKKPNYDKIFAPTKCTGNDCNVLSEGTQVRYLLDEPIDITSGKKLHGKFRATDIKWSIKPTTIERYQLMPNQPILYKLKGKSALYTKNQLQIVDINSKLPPLTIQKKFIIEKIIGKLQKNGKVYYRVKWKNYDDITVEPRTSLINDVPLLVSSFEESIKKKQ